MWRGIRRVSNCTFVKKVSFERPARERSPGQVRRFVISNLKEAPVALPSLLTAISQELVANYRGNYNVGSGCNFACHDSRNRRTISVGWKRSALSVRPNFLPPLPRLPCLHPEFTWKFRRIIPSLGNSDFFPLPSLKIETALCKYSSVERERKRFDFNSFWKIGKFGKRSRRFFSKAWKDLGSSSSFFLFEKQKRFGIKIFEDSPCCNCYFQKIRFYPDKEEEIRGRESWINSSFDTPT